MKKVLASVVIAVLAFCGLSGAVITQSLPVQAAGIDKVNEFVTESNDGNTTDLMPMIQTIVTVVLGIIGLICVAMIIVGGVTYTTSQGNPEKVKQGKDIILYAIVGLVVALLAYAIVTFVLQNIFGK